VNLDDIRLQAEKEIEHELFREAVEKEKRRLREYRPFWDRIFPWRIIIVRKKDVRY